MTKFKEWPDEPIDLLVGGTPCQPFSIAGLRAGLADPRGNLMLTYLAVAAKYRPRWLVWENVPGVLSSNSGRDFGTFLGGLVELGYGFAYRVLDAQYIRVGGFERAVPQRRRRVFVVGYLGDWRRAAAVLFDAQSLRGDSAPRREAGQGVAPTISARTKGGGGLGTDFDLDVGLITDDVARCVTAGYSQRIDAKTENFVATREVAASLTRGAESAGKGGYAGRRQEDDDNLVAHALRAEGFDASEDGTGRGTPIVPIAFDTTQITSAANRSVPKAGDPCHPLAAGAHPPAIAFNPKAGGNPTIGKSYLNDGSCYTLDTDCTSVAVQSAWAVRRLTPLECERLQGFPDGFTDVPYRNRNWTPDGPRYRALGNSMAVNAMRWIGERIAIVDTVSACEAA
jgi:DNA (cytosine-5)-methyltransferase 1